MSKRLQRDCKGIIYEPSSFFFPASPRAKTAQAKPRETLSGVKLPRTYGSHAKTLSETGAAKLPRTYGSSPRNGSE